MNIFLIIIIIIILLYWFYSTKSYSTFKKTLGQEKYRKEIQTDTHYVCWTGGYDSTFRICQLIHARERIQPIYLSMEDVDDDRENKNRVQRKNKKNEIQSMEEIRRLLEDKYPHAQYLLLPTLYINELGPPYPEIQKCASYLYSKLGWFTRKVNQYERILQLSYKSPEPLEICVGTDDGLSKSIKKFVVGVGRNCRLVRKLPDKYKCACIFEGVRFPIIHLTKEDMLKIATENGYEKMLAQSWSCWTPVMVNGKDLPCGQCDMCRHRIKLESHF